MYHRHPSPPSASVAKFEILWGDTVTDSAWKERLCRQAEYCSFGCRANRDISISSPKRSIEKQQAASNSWCFQINPPGSRRNSTRRTLHNSDLKTRRFGWTACHFGFKPSIYIIDSVPDHPQQVLASHQTLWKPAQCGHLNTPKLLWGLNQRTPPRSKTMAMRPKKNANQKHGFDVSVPTCQWPCKVSMQRFNAHTCWPLEHSKTLPLPVLQETYVADIAWWQLENATKLCKCFFPYRFIVCIYIHIIAHIHCYSCLTSDSRVTTSSCGKGATPFWKHSCCGRQQTASLFLHLVSAPQQHTFIIEKVWQSMLSDYIDNCNGGLTKAETLEEQLAGLLNMG